MFASGLEFPLLAQTSTQSEAASSPSTISASNLLASSKAASLSTNYYKTLSPPIDRITSSYLRRGYGLQISGPPGACVEQLVLGLVKSVTSAEKEVVFVDMQNKIKADIIDVVLNSDARAERVHYCMLHKLPEIVELLTSLSTFLSEHPNVSLLVLSSLSFPFQAEPSFSKRNATIDRVRELVVKLCKQHGIATVITTTMTTQFLHPDGSRGSFGDDTKGVLSPQIDFSCKSISSLIISRKDAELGRAVLTSEMSQATLQTEFKFADIGFRENTSEP